MTAYFFVLDPTSQAVGMLQTGQVFQLTGKNELACLVNLSVCDIHGEDCTTFPGLGTLTGKRMIVKDLPTQ